MPTYTYECQACDHTFDKFQSISAEREIDCPVCGEPQLQRLIGGGAAIVFKGSGFYQTDYRSDSYKKAADADKPKEKSSGEKSGAKSESKSTTKAD